MKLIFIILLLITLFSSCHTATEKPTLATEPLFFSMEDDYNSKRYFSVIDQDTVKYPVTTNGLNLFIFEEPDDMSALTAINLFSEILPFAVSEWNDSIKSADILFPYSFTQKYPLKIARIATTNYLDTTTTPYDGQNQMINSILVYSNLKQNISDIMSRHGYKFEAFSSEKVSINVKKLKKSLNASTQDSIELLEKPFIGMLWISFSKKE